MKKTMSGFSLLEVMITVFILAIGILGVSGMQLASLKGNQGAYHRSQANFLAADILDRMRANADGFANDDYDGIDTGSSSASKPTCIDSDNGCDSASIAAYDIHEWLLKFPSNASTGLIPGSKGTVETNGLTGITTVKVEWPEIEWVDGEKSSVTKSVDVTVRLF
ncbi:type IV pilus modification protein PilV [Oceanicoccus sagamiensis]|uniref:Type IV pilus modification protein PilV n=2 Tax=Oceanicoccus sagamiensis TaxID=716816 RepID=A0A1X9NR23_9GAMM|nr:type IV pilus modification protein PilV [Oceanicoccus sagamiensis]